MDVPLIKDREHLEAWLKTRSREECIAIAHRAAMRVAPIWLEDGVRLTDFFNSKPDISRLWCLVISAVGSRGRNDKIVRNARAASRYSAGIAASTDCSQSAKAVYNDHHYAMDSAKGVDYSFEFFGYKNDFQLSIIETIAWDALWLDLKAISSGENVMIMPLWHELAWPYFAEWAKANIRLARLGIDWGFWVRWYDAVLRGQPLNWKMQEEIALISPEVWEGDVAGLAAAIAVIEEKHNLLDQIADLKAKLIEAKAQDQIFDSTLAHKWHNNPPELLDTVAEVREQFTLVLQAIDEAEDELKRPNPDPSVLRAIGTFLLGAGKSLLVYCASLADVMLKKAAEEIGSTGTKVLIFTAATYFLAQAEPIQSIGKSMLELAVKLASGG